MTIKTKSQGNTTKQPDFITEEMSVSQYAKRTGFTDSAVRWQCKYSKLRGEATARKVGNSWVITVRELAVK